MRNRILPFLLALSALWGSSPLKAQTLWGATSAGVADNKGVIFKTNANGSGYSVRHNFVTDFPGSAPYSSLTLSGGKLYGTSSSGGANDQGVIFEFDPATGIYTKKVDLSAATTGSFPYGGMVKAADGLLYGVTSSGGNNSVGVLFEYNPGGTSLTVRHHFTAATGSNPNGSLIQAANGKFYGLAPLGGAMGSGVLFEYDIAFGYLAKFDFDGTNGSQPYGDLVEHANGKLYGLTSGGGSGGAGVLFEFDPATGITTKKKDISAVGTNPYGSLTNAGTTLFGMTLFGGANSEGVIFEYDPAGNALTKKKDLSASVTGSYPLGSFYKATNGLLYGMTSGGGSAGDGTIIEYNTSLNTVSKEFDFASLISGRNPQYNNLVEASGKLYGMTAFGGPVDHGVLFEFDHTTSTFNKKVDFSNSTEGSNPQGSLIRASNGLLYGLTSKGGAFGQGVLFSIDPATDAYIPIEDFSLTAFGAYPNGALVEAANGKLYGMAPYGGSHDNGVIFEYNPVGDYFFKRIDLQASITGSKPQGSLVSAANGKLYGTTSQGGTNGFGTLFEFDPATLTVTNTVSFNGAGNGSTPTGTLLQAANGKLYGLTSQGGIGGNGVVFEYNTTTGVLTKKADFTGTNGANPFGELMQATNGKLYGMTSGGGANSYGVIFEFDPVTNGITDKFDFDQTNSGAGPAGGLTEVAQGDLFGMNPSGGAGGVGVYFKFTLAGAFTKLMDFGGANGSSPQFASVLIVPPKSNQTITFNALPAKTITDAPFALTATSTSGLTITYVSSNPSIASISGGNTVTINNGGTVTITASQYGNTTYHYAQDVVQTLVINKTSQTITFTLPPKTYGDTPFVLNGTASSGLAVSYVSADLTIATIAGSTLTILKAGTVTITASQAGNATYDPAPDVALPLVISKADQTITFSQPGLPLGQVPFTNLTENLVASSTSGLTITFSAAPAGIVSIAGNVATFLNSGTVTITAMQIGNGNYNAAPDVSKLLTIDQGGQTISFPGPLPAKAYGDPPFDLTATASSGLPVVFTSTDPTVVSISGNTVTILKPGSITIKANQPGNGSFGPAPEEIQPLLISQGSQTITFNPLPARSVSDGSFTLTATVSSGLPITYVSDNTSVITISGSTATIQGLGNANITASQPGDVNYLAATSVAQLQVINNKLSQTITFNTLPSKSFGDAPFNLTATATSGLPVTFASSNPAVATISGTTVTIVGSGTTTITASQAGDATYNPAPDVPRTQLVQGGPQTITFNPIAPVTFGDSPFSLTATASSGLPISYVNLSSSKISISGDVVTIIATGRATVRARQDGGSNYSAATPVDQIFCINPVKPTITVTNLTTSSATLTSSAPGGNQWYKNGFKLTPATGQVLNATSGGVYAVNVTIETCVSVFSDDENLLITGDINTQQPTPILYPNPAGEKLYVDLTSFEPTVVTIKAFDIAGRQLLSENHSGGQTVEMNVDGYSPGVYLLVIGQGENTSRVRWIKQ